jgi:DNA-directed RNA polymerase specialized sigma24 family protein
MRFSRKKRSDGKGSSDFASHSDFCAIFIRQLDRLYSLAVILTGNELRAEECVLAALDSCAEGSTVFKESAITWSRRNVIKHAIRFMEPSPASPSRSNLFANRCDSRSDQDASFKSVQKLSHFDRFAFVMSVLERYSDRDCALLLGCSRADVVNARIRAFQQISRSATERYLNYGSGAPPYAVNADWLECG